MRTLYFRIVFIAIFLAALSLSVTLRGMPVGAPDEKKDKFEVTIDNFSFSPQSLTVAAGTEVTWINHDDVPHNVISTDKKFASPVLDTDEKFTYKFGDPGTYNYYCSIHPRMTGKVIVN